MRIINLNEFLSMPSGTVYCKYESFGNLGEICIKSDTRGVDWLYSELANFDSESSEDFFDKVSKAEKDSTFEIDNDPTTIQRDGMFEDDQMFAVFNLQDVHEMIEALREAFKLMIKAVD